MTDPRYIGTILYVGLAIFAALLAAGLLMQERRRSVQKAALLWGAEGLILLLDLYLCFGLLPAPLRLPVSLTVGFLSYSAVFIAYFFQLFISICSGTMCSGCAPSGSLTAVSSPGISTLSTRASSCAVIKKL